MPWRAASGRMVPWRSASELSRLRPKRPVRLVHPDAQDTIFFFPDVSASISAVLCLLLTYYFLGCSLLLRVCLTLLLCYVYCLPCVFVISYCL